MDAYGTGSVKDRLEDAGGGSGAIVVNVDVRDLDKVIHAISQEAMAWYDKLNAQPTPARKAYLMARHPRVKVGTELTISVTDIDDYAELRFNGFDFNNGGPGKDIRQSHARVQRGHNFVILYVANSGAHRWNFCLDVRDPKETAPPIFSECRGADDGFDTVRRFFWLSFEGV